MKDIIKLFWQLIIGKGITLASKDLYKKRIKICRSNVCGVYNNPLKLGLLENCGDCGCSLRTKNRIDEFYIKCPKDLW
tara:strand:+ start:5728 stop:5961 length:234 start_codon:yes stop_codon:yes gene_type:complete